MAENLFTLLARQTVQRMGLQPKPVQPTPRFETSVDVTAPRPAPNAPYPPDLPEILFGSRSQLPTGTYMGGPQSTSQVLASPPDFDKALFPPLMMDPTVAEEMRYLAPALRDATGSFTADHPWVQRIMGDVFLDPTMRGSRILAKTWPDRDVGVNPWGPIFDFNQLIPILGHEAAHAANARNFPDADAAMRAYNAGGSVLGRFIPGGKLPLGEEQADEVERQLLARRTRR